MDLYQSISRRKACRKYNLEPLSEDIIEKIKNVLDTATLLFLDAPITYHFVTEAGGLFHVKAPHYLVFRGQGIDGEQENAGFIGQKLMLWLDANELGGVWLGASKDTSKQKNSSDIIMLAFGKPEGSPHRNLNEFKRKPIEDITNNPHDVCVKAVHLAPSGMNLQPWYIVVKEDKLGFYRQKLKPPMSFLYKLTKVDMGIALFHCKEACEKSNKAFKFNLTSNFQPKKGYDFFGEVDLS